MLLMNKHTQPLYGHIWVTCIYWQTKLRTGDFCWSKVCCPYALDDGD